MQSIPRRARWPMPWQGADVFFGLSVAGALTPAMVKSMAPQSRSSSPWPIPTLRSRLKMSAKVRDDAIMATGRSDYPNQVNNVLGFPYIFRGALDVRARTINDEMKIAAAEALGRPRARGRARRGRCRLSRLAALHSDGTI